MAAIPTTRYAKTVDGVNIAYQVVGDGPDLVLSQGWISNIEVQWEIPAWRKSLERLASFSRLTVFDKRGVGLSDRGVGTPGVEEKMDDTRWSWIRRDPSMPTSSVSPKVASWRCNSPPRIQLE